MKTIRLAWLCPILFLLPHAAAQQPYLNLDFETGIGSRVCCWLYDGLGYDVGVDTSVAYSGAKSFRLRTVNPVYNGAWVAQWLPIDQVRGHHVQFSGYVKTAGITKGHAGLWLLVYNGTSLVSMDEAPSGVTNGTTGWQQFITDRDVSPQAPEVLIEGFLYGQGSNTYPNGTVWFDDLAVSVDGAPFPQGPAVCQPTPAQQAWMAPNAHPFTTPDAGNGFDDLAPVKAMVGNARIVGLGEGTHGTSEFFRMKHRLLEYLATEMGFTVFAIEANMPEAYRMNDYVLNGNGDPKKLLQGMYFWTWNTQEVLDMVEWMRQFNLSGKGRLQFTGFDMQYGSVADANVANFVTQADPGYYTTLSQAYATALGVQVNQQQGTSQPVATVRAAIDGVHAVWQYLSDHRSDYLASFSAGTVNWAIQNAVIMEQATTIALNGAGAYRDQSMASNIEWIASQNPGAKIVLWAHNYHVGRSPGAMGSYLAATYGSGGPVIGVQGKPQMFSRRLPPGRAGYVVFAQIFNAGSYNAYSGSVLGPNLGIPSYPGTLEWFFHASGMPRLMLDMRSASAGDPGSSWILGPTQSRLFIGAIIADDGGFHFTYRPGQLTQDYDVLIFFDQTTPSELLPFN